MTNQKVPTIRIETLDLSEFPALDMLINILENDPQLTAIIDESTEDETLLPTKLSEILKTTIQPSNKDELPQDVLHCITPESSGTSMQFTINKNARIKVLTNELDKDITNIIIHQFNKGGSSYIPSIKLELKKVTENSSTSFYIAYDQELERPNSRLFVDIMCIPNKNGTQDIQAQKTLVEQKTTRKNNETTMVSNTKTTTKLLNRKNPTYWNN